RAPPTRCRPRAGARPRCIPGGRRLRLRARSRSSSAWWDGSAPFEDGIGTGDGHGLAAAQAVARGVDHGERAEVVARVGDQRLAVDHGPAEVLQDGDVAQLVLGPLVTRGHILREVDRLVVAAAGQQQRRLAVLALVVERALLALDLQAL